MLTGEFVQNEAPMVRAEVENRMIELIDEFNDFVGREASIAGTPLNIALRNLAGINMLRDNDIMIAFPRSIIEMICCAASC